MQRDTAVATTRDNPVTLDGIPESFRGQLVDALNHNLANLSDISAAFKQAHWNVLGARFAQLHRFFDEMHEQTRELIDTVAERAVTLGGSAHGTIQATVAGSSLAPFPTDEHDAWTLVEQLGRRMDVVAAELRKAVDTSAKDPATQDVFIEVLRDIEKQRWMVKAHLVREPAFYS